MDQKTVAPVTLTNENPNGFFPVSSDVVKCAPATVAIAVTRVSNPSLTAFEIQVYLVPPDAQPDKKGAAADKILIGDFSLYPADHPARFVLRSADAFKKMSANGNGSDGVRLLIELKRMRESGPWPPMQVTFDPPQWLPDEPK